MLTIIRMPGTEKCLLRRHPGIFPTAIDRPVTTRFPEGEYLLRLQRM